ncbi:YY1-associated factor 2 isoform X2 [Engraulis encrasicolus]|uniref:YY1-associated factor 2 isoform X2 n=1 Tax=Engraulis encrasicolus TaxID=184585 RepID=UPI002FD0CDF1
MGDKKSPTRPKRQPKPSADDGYWDCSVCTFRNTAEAFKCMICDVRKGTSTRKPRPVSQLVSQQVSPQFASPQQPKKERRERPEKERGDKEHSLLKRNSHKRMRPRLKNIDRSSAQHLEVTVGDLTVIITDFKEKPPSAKVATPPNTSSHQSAASADQLSQSGSGSDNNSSERTTPTRINTERMTPTPTPPAARPAHRPSSPSPRTPGPAHRPSSSAPSSRPSSRPASRSSSPSPPEPAALNGDSH